MNFIGVEKTSLTNGSGLRCVLWVAGCNHHCRGCQNPSTWDPKAGRRFYVSDYVEIRKRVEKDYCDGLTLSGGDPMYPGNRSAILSLCKLFRIDFGHTKTIWMYTGYKFSEIRDDPILDYLDVIVDGPYIESKRSPTRQWVGSENQRVWRKAKGFWIMEEPKYADKRMQ